MRQMSLCPSCRHQVVVMRRGELVFCTREQKLTHPHLVCQRFLPVHGADPQAVRECERRKAAYRPGEPCISRKG